MATRVCLPAACIVFYSSFAGLVSIGGPPRVRVCLDNFERQSFWAICLVEYRPVTVA